MCSVYSIQCTVCTVNYKLYATIHCSHKWAVARATRQWQHVGFLYPVYLGTVSILLCVYWATVSILSVYAWLQCVYNALGHSEQCIVYRLHCVQKAEIVYRLQFNYLLLCIQSKEFTPFSQEFNLTISSPHPWDSGGPSQTIIDYIANSNLFNLNGVYIFFCALNLFGIFV